MTRSIPRLRQKGVSIITAIFLLVGLSALGACDDPDDRDPEPADHG
ncbi:MAG: hypothetical protein ABFS39_14520 [Pseudomonadota bacterium]